MENDITKTSRQMMKIADSMSTSGNSAQANMLRNFVEESSALIAASPSSASIIRAEEELSVYGSNSSSMLGKRSNVQPDAEYNASVNVGFTSVANLIEVFRWIDTQKIPQNHEYDFYLSQEDKKRLHQLCLTRRLILELKPMCLSRCKYWKNRDHMDKEIKMYMCTFEKIKPLRSQSNSARFLYAITYSFAYEEIQNEFGSKPLVMTVIVSCKNEVFNKLHLLTFYFTAGQ